MLDVASEYVFLIMSLSFGLTVLLMLGKILTDVMYIEKAVRNAKSEASGKMCNCSKEK